MSTLFDAIIDGRIPASFVHRDAHCVAFMDINPITRGHVLVVPRQSVATLDALDPVVRAHLWDIARRVGGAQRAGLGSKAQHFLLNDGKAASQTVPHVHIHVIPRYGNDSVRTIGRMIWHVSTLMVRRPETTARRQRLDALAARIATKMI
jgi:histidine triad (HIT) family protein